MFRRGTIIGKLWVVSSRVDETPSASCVSGTRIQSTNSGPDNVLAYDDVDIVTWMCLAFLDHFPKSPTNTPGNMPFFTCFMEDLFF